MTDYSSSTPQDFTVTDLVGGSVWTHGLRTSSTGGSGTQSSPFEWQAALSATGSGQFTLHYWRSGSTNNWGHTSRTDITGTVSSGVVTINFNGSDIFTFNESDAFVSSGGGTGTEGVNTPYVTWGYPNRSCGENAFVSVTHTVAQSFVTTYYVHELGVGQIGTIFVGTGAYPSTSGAGNYSFTISDRTLQVKNASGHVLGTKVFTCSKKVFSNFW